MERIFIYANEVWGLFYSCKGRTQGPFEPIKLAESPDYGVDIYLSESNGRPLISVYVDDDEFLSEECINREDCFNTVREYYDRYLTMSAIDTLCGDDAEDIDDDMQHNTEIEDREEEIDFALEDFLSTILETDAKKISGKEKIIPDLKEHFLEYMYRKWRLDIRRPMYLEDENGEEFYEDYPYECMEFEDADNPIYK